MRRFTIALLAALCFLCFLCLLGVLLVLSCRSGDKNAPAASPTAAGKTPAATPTAKSTPSPTRATPTVSTAEETAVAATPLPEATSCAAGITAELRGIDSRVDWAVYCPTYLPPGYEEELIGGPNPLDIQIVNPATGARIYFMQGLGTNFSVIARARDEGELVGPVPYGDLEGQLLRSLPGAEPAPFVAVLALPEGESGPIHYIEAYGVSEDEIRPIAAGMRRLDTIP